MSNNQAASYTTSISLLKAPCSLALLLLLMASGLPVKAQAEAPPAEVAEKITRAKAAIGALKTALESALQAAMKNGGPENAITVCNEKALSITKGIAKAEGLEIRRTALRLRNPANAPDDWERQMLEQFKARHNQGEALAPMAAHKLEDGEFRFLKAIPTGGLCLKCHGASVKPALMEKIKSLYPSDEATGFLAGDLRGAFSVAIPPE